MTPEHTSREPSARIHVIRCTECGRFVEIPGPAKELDSPIVTCRKCHNVIFLQEIPDDDVEFLDGKPRDEEERTFSSVPAGFQIKNEQQWRYFLLVSLLLSAFLLYRLTLSAGGA